MYFYFSWQNNYYIKRGPLYKQIFKKKFLKRVGEIGENMKN